MLPEAQHYPSRGFELVIRISVSLSVCLDLVPPPASIRLWPSPVPRAPMPKASIHENGDLAPRKNDIGSSASAWQRSVDLEPQTNSPERRSKRHFRRRISASGRLHPSSNIGRRCAGPSSMRCGFSSHSISRAAHCRALLDMTAYAASDSCICWICRWTSLKNAASNLRPLMRARSRNPAAARAESGDRGKRRNERRLGIFLRTGNGETSTE
jgi:hypothetical protein